MEVLQEFSDFLEKNPREVITFFIEDRLNNNALFRTVLGQANLSKHLLNTTHFGRGTKAWPTLEQTASGLGRLVVFSDNMDETSVIAYTYNYVIENNFGNPSQDTNVSDHLPNFSFSFCYFAESLRIILRTSRCDSAFLPQKPICSKLYYICIHEIGNMK